MDTYIGAEQREAPGLMGHYLKKSRESIGYYTGLGQGILVELNPSILVRDAILMLNVILA